MTEFYKMTRNCLKCEKSASIPVLASSAAYAFADTQATATVFDLSLELVPLDPVKTLFWSAVINGFVALPIMIAMLMVVSCSKQMKEFTAPVAMKICGWAATGVKGVAAVAMLIA